MPFFKAIGRSRWVKYSSQAQSLEINTMEDDTIPNSKIIYCFLWFSQIFSLNGFNSSTKPTPPSSIPSNSVRSCVSGNSLVQNKVEIKTSKARGRPSLPSVLVRSSISGSKNNQRSTKHHWNPGVSNPARRHYSSRIKSHTAEVMSKATLDF